MPEKRRKVYFKIDMDDQLARSTGARIYLTWDAPDDGLSIFETFTEAKKACLQIARARVKQAKKLEKQLIDLRKVDVKKWNNYKFEDEY